MAYLEKHRWNFGAFFMVPRLAATKIGVYESVYKSTERIILQQLLFIHRGHFLRRCRSGYAVFQRLLLSNPVE